MKQLSVLNMSCNIYEEPTISMNDGAKDRVERVVGIYESCDAYSNRRPSRMTPPRAPPSARIDPSSTALLILGLLCLLLLVGISVMSYFYLQKSEVQAPLSTSWFQEQVNQTRKEGLCPKGWRRYQCNCYNLSTEKKTWNDSRKDCTSRRAKLVTVENYREQVFIGKLGKHEDFWIGLESASFQKSEWIWVDGTVPGYKNFPRNTNVKAGIKSYVYNDKNGYWSCVQDGTKLWMCEKPLFEDSEDDEQ